MKNYSFFLALIMLTSCTHKQPTETHPNFDRLPSSVSRVSSCGFLGSTETARNAVDVNYADKIDDRFYSLQLDCNKDRRLNTQKETKIAGFPVNQVSSQQKGWITRWRKMAVKAEKNPAARPYVCVNYQASYDPCLENKNVYGLAPKFSSKVVVRQKVR